ncbi:MAG: DUF2628 domain-containing protein [Methyloceanibacter sp.]|uniref:DUF2628 domain-containing protein n=1 Tax=Methyloceanibacter sp. TaxID=1965321 RepID=UPI003D6CB2DB
MTVYSVYEPASGDEDVVARADKVAFVKDGFSWPAFFVPALWLFYHRMWIELIVFLIVFSVLPWVFGFDQQGEQLFGWVSLGLITLFAFEANDLRGAALSRRGYRLAGVAAGRDRIEAERSFFTAWLAQQQTPRSPEPPRKAARGGDAPSPKRGGEGDEVIGLFPQA